MLTFLDMLFFPTFCSSLNFFKEYFKMNTFSFIIKKTFSENLFESLLEQPWWSFLINTFEIPVG